MSKRLYRIEEDSCLAGVCSGIGEYMELDPVVVRVIFVLLTLLTGILPMCIVYAVMYLLVPEK